MWHCVCVYVRVCLCVFSSSIRIDLARRSTAHRQVTTSRRQHTVSAARTGREACRADRGSVPRVWHMGERPGPVPRNSIWMYWKYLIRDRSMHTIRLSIARVSLPVACLVIGASFLVVWRFYLLPGCCCCSWSVYSRATRAYNDRLHFDAWSRTETVRNVNDTV